MLVKCFDEAVQTPYFDLVNCFEYVEHGRIWMAGLKLKLNNIILRVIIRIYTSVPRVVLSGVYTKGKR